MFVINNNNLILVGSDSVWVFDFGNKMLICNPYEMHLKEENTLMITDELLENVLNMTLYAFGKWGKIKGLIVEKGYPQLNNLFVSFLSEIHVEPVMTVENLRFFKNGVQFTYEDIIQNVLDKQLQEETEIENNDDGIDDVEKVYNSKFNKGLWHKIIWKSGHDSFVKGSIVKSEQDKARIGNNFYMVSYKCPDCGEELFMVVYPEGKEYLIETDEKEVYLARAYTCSTCHRMYTPKPHMLLLDGDVFCLDFQDDSVAYEDYLEVIGKQGERTSNSNFNEYEADYNKKRVKKQEQLEEICSEMNSMNDQEILELQDKLDSGFYPKKSIDKFQNVVDAELKSRQKQSSNKGILEEVIKDERDRQDSFTSKTEETHQGIILTSDKIQSDNGGRVAYDQSLGFGSSVDSHYNEKAYEESEYYGNLSRDTISIEDSDYWQSKKKDEEEASKGFMEATNLSSENVVKDTKLERFPDKKVNAKVESTISSDKEKELLMKAVQCKDKNYKNIVRVMNEIKKEDFNQGIKDPILHSLKELLEKRGKAELDNIFLKIPNNISKAQYIQYTQVMEQYEEIDKTTYKKRLELIRGETEKREIATYINRAKAKDSKSLTALYHKLKKEDFDKRIVAPFLEKINEKIYAIDEAIIRKICPDPAKLTFEDGLKAYEEISTKDLLPELQTNILSKIDDRLRKIKMNECELLINKLTKEMGNQAQNCSRIHFYDVRKGMRNNNEDEETQIMIKAQNTYATGRGKYEFPILICDTSSKRNGGKGFILTPDHIFYNSMVNSGIIDIKKIEDIKAVKRIFITGIFANTLNIGKVRISNSLGINNLKDFAQVLNDFIVYLNEKPQSRDISYMAEEKHKVKCCYRCGFVYHGDNDCPKCGAKINE